MRSSATGVTSRSLRFTSRTATCTKFCSIRTRASRTLPAGPIALPLECHQPCIVACEANERILNTVAIKPGGTFIFEADNKATFRDFNRASADNHALAVCGAASGAHKLNYLFDSLFACAIGSRASPSKGNNWPAPPQDYDLFWRPNGGGR